MPTNVKERLSEIEGHNKPEVLIGRRVTDQPVNVTEADHFKAKHWGPHNALSPETGGSGGYTVSPPLTSSEIMAIGLTEASVMRRYCKVVPGESIDEVFPWLSDGTTEGRQMAAGEAPTEVDPSFGARQSYGHKYTSDRVLAPFELVRDAKGLEPAVLTAQSRRVGRRQNRAFTLGTGGNEPTGLANGCQVGATTASSIAIAADDVISLIASLDSEYTASGSARLMFHPLIQGYLMKLKDGAGLNLWDASGLGDYPFVLNSHMPSSITSGSPVILYGDFARAYTIRELETRFITYNEMYVEQDCVGYEVLQIADGFVTDDSAVKSLVVAS